MELIGDIINSLVDEKSSLKSALLKTKVLAKRINNAELSNWINNEINGYSNREELPKYRLNIPNQLIGTYINGNAKLTNQQLPTTGLPTFFEENLLQSNFLQSVTNLEELVQNEASELSSPLNAELISMIEQNMIKMGNPYLQLVSARKAISKSILSEILTNVRSKLLDFMLEIENQFGTETQISNLKENTDKVTNIMNNTIINNGHGNVINTGNDVEINNETVITKGNKELLNQKLEEHGVSQEDRTELLEIIDEEAPNIENQTFGKKVNDWTKKLVGKAVDGTWTIGLATAGGMLVEVLKGYYGM